MTRKYKHIALILFAIMFILPSFSLVNATLVIGNNDTSVRLGSVLAANYSSVNVNNSFYWQSYTPTTFDTYLDGIFQPIGICYNTSYLTSETDSKSILLINGNNTAWLSTYNSTYEGNINSILASTSVYNSTYNSSYLTAVASDSTWTLHNSYPAACSAGQFVGTIGDTNTCAAPSSQYLTFIGARGHDTAGQTISKNVVDYVSGAQDYDQGGDNWATTGTYTCPITGYYHVDGCVTLNGQDIGDSMYVDFYYDSLDWCTALIL